MILVLHTCMPEGEPMRQEWARAANFMRDDNRYVVASMLASGLHVPDRVEDLGAQYVPELKRWRCPNDHGDAGSPRCPRCGAVGSPILKIFGMRDIQQRGKFSCGDACAYEAAVWIEKYGVNAHCEAVAQGDDDYHGIFITDRGAVDPVARYLGSPGGPRAPNKTKVSNTSRCSIHGGRVVCDGGPEACCIGDDGIWHCPPVPALHGRREELAERMQSNAYGARWARTKHGALVPGCRSGGRR